eukprot:5428157-Alexandrium_andersonii.AAC.1
MGQLARNTPNAQVGRSSAEGVLRGPAGRRPPGPVHGSRVSAQGRRLAGSDAPPASGLGPS